MTNLVMSQWNNVEFGKFLDTSATSFISMFKKSSILVAVFETTHTGNPVVILGPYRYNRVSKTKCKGPKIRWTCIKYPYGCRAAIYTYENVIFKVLNEHNH